MRGSRRRVRVLDVAGRLEGVDDRPLALDALDPNDLRDIFTTAIFGDELRGVAGCWDYAAYDKVLEREKPEPDQLGAVLEQYRSGSQ